MPVAPTTTADPAQAEAKARDQLWTLLVPGHRELRRVGMWLWVEDADEHVPPLQSRRTTARKQGEG